MRLTFFLESRSSRNFIAAEARLTFDEQQAGSRSRLVSASANEDRSVEKVRELRSPPKEGLAGHSEVALANLPEAS